MRNRANLEEVFKTIKNAVNGNWNYQFNNDCKYINVNIDMRDGNCYITNRFK